MDLIKTIRRFVPWTQWQTGPTACPAEVSLLRGNATPEGVYVIKTPWACFSAPKGEGTTEEDLLRALPNSYATAEEAAAAARRTCPHYHAPYNQLINSRLADSIRWQDDFMGPGVLADYVGVTREELYKLARGAIKATARQAGGARNYHGQRRYQTA